MALLGIKYFGDYNIINDFMKDTKEKLKDYDIVKNPFKGGIVEFVDKNIYVIEMTPVYYNFSVFGYVYILIIYVFIGLSLWAIPGIILVIMGLFWSKYFFFFMLKIGLKKYGYKGKIKLLKNKDLLETLYFK